MPLVGKRMIGFVFFFRTFRSSPKYSPDSEAIQPMYATPLGSLWLHTQDGAITALSQVPSEAPVDRHWQTRVGSWLEAFFQGSFLSLETFPLAPQGTPFQHRVWALLREIPLGRIETYGSLARCLRTSPRAVGHALSCNPLPILIPCHRVLAAHDFGGYSGAGGVMGKRLLLHLEGVTLVNDLS